MSTDSTEPKPKKAAASFRVKPVSRANNFVKFRSCRCFKDAHDRIVAGWSMPDVAEFVQTERGEYTDITREAMVDLLGEYRKSIPPGVLVQKRMPKEFKNAVEKIEQGIDELGELQKLYELQMSRITIDNKTEKAIGKLMPTMTAEIKEARSILESYAQLKMDLGVTKRHLGQAEIDMALTADVGERYGRRAVGMVLEDPEARRRVVGLAERLVSVLGKGEAEAAAVEELILDAELVNEDSELETVINDQ